MSQGYRTKVALGRLSKPHQIHAHRTLPPGAPLEVEQRTNWGDWAVIAACGVIACLISWGVLA